MSFADDIDAQSSTSVSAMNIVDSHFMKLALDEARKAAMRGEVPIGALVVRSMGNDGATNGGSTNRTSMFQVLSADSNRVEEKRDASAHAEMLAMRKAAWHNQDATWRLLNTTLYSTVEPCVMCLAAAQAFRVGRIVYGAPDLRLGAIDTHMKLLDHPHPFHTIDKVDRGLFEEESAELLRGFFQAQRAKKKAEGRSCMHEDVPLRRRLIFWRNRNGQN